MSEPSLEERVIKLEKMMDNVLQNLDISARKKDWRRTVGMFDGDPLMKEIIEEGQRIGNHPLRSAGNIQQKEAVDRVVARAAANEHDAPAVG